MKADETVKQVVCELEDTIARIQEEESSEKAKTEAFLKDHPAIADALQEVANILSEREEEYGRVDVSVNRIASMWSAYKDDFSGEDFLLMQIMTKISRLRTQYKRDSALDIMGYALLIIQLNEQ